MVDIFSLYDHTGVFCVWLEAQSDNFSTKVMTSARGRDHFTSQTILYMPFVNVMIVYLGVFSLFHVHEPPARILGAILPIERYRTNKLTDLNVIGFAEFSLLI